MIDWLIDLQVRSTVMEAPKESTAIVITASANMVTDLLVMAIVIKELDFPKLPLSEIFRTKKETLQNAFIKFLTISSPLYC